MPKRTVEQLEDELGRANRFAIDYKDERDALRAKAEEWKSLCLEACSVRDESQARVAELEIALQLILTSSSDRVAHEIAHATLNK